MRRNVLEIYYNLMSCKINEYYYTTKNIYMYIEGEFFSEENSNEN